MPIWLLIALRVIHIGSAVAWVGFVFLFSGFVTPTARSLDPVEGSRYLNRLLDHRWFSIYVSSVEGLAVLTGGVLYWNVSGGFDLDWITSPTGAAFGIGGLAAVAAVVVGIWVSATLSRLYRLGEDITGHPADRSREGDFYRLHRTLSRRNRLNTLLVSLAVIAMAAARYL